MVSMIITLPEKLEAALNLRASAQGIFPAGYICDVLERELAPTLEDQSHCVPFEVGRGSLAKYGQAPSSDGIDANRADMFRSFGAEIS